MTSVCIYNSRGQATICYENGIFTLDWQEIPGDSHTIAEPSVYVVIYVDSCSNKPDRWQTWDEDRRQSWEGATEAQRLLVYLSLTLPHFNVFEKLLNKNHISLINHIMLSMYECRLPVNESGIQLRIKDKYIYNVNTLTNQGTRVGILPAATVVNTPEMWENIIRGIIDTS